MKTYFLKINANNLRNEIKKDYFKYRDIFFKCLIGNLCVHNQLYKSVLSSTIIEDSHYNQYLMYLISRNPTLKEIVAEIDTPFNISVFLDTSVYLEEFIQTKHDSTKLNVYQLTIDDNFNVVITVKLLNYVK